MNFFSGIGARETPPPILAVIQPLSRALISAPLSYTLRTGGAKGADQAFIQGAYDTIATRPNPEIYIPSLYYERASLAHIHDSSRFKIIHDVTASAYIIASRFHPAWDRLPSYAEPLHARNTHIVLGPDPLHNPTPVQFIVCYTPAGFITGGTGQALRIAAHYQIPVLNLGKPHHLEHAEDIVRGFEAGILQQETLDYILSTIREED